MAKFRMINTSFWDDPRVVEELTPEDKYFFLYLLTNNNTTQIGIYQITKKQMAFDLGYSLESVNSLMDRFIKYDFIKYDTDTRELAIKNWGRYNLVRGGKPMLDCVKKELKEVKCLSFISYVGKHVANESIKEVYDTYTIREDGFSVGADSANNESLIENTEKTDDEGKHCSDGGSHDTSTIRGQYKEKEEEKEEEYKDRVRDLFNHYISKNIIQHKKINPAIRSAIKSRLKDYSYDELCCAIDNYANVFFSDKHWFTHKYPLADFMRDKDIRKFVNEADPLNNFLIKSKNMPTFSGGMRKEDFDLS